MMDTRIVQVTNICPNINVEQIKTFLGFVGRLEQLKLYPERMHFVPGGSPGTTKVCYAKYAKQDDATVALHLSNTVFIDRALIVAPYDMSMIPDEQEAMRHATPIGLTGQSFNPANDMFAPMEGGAANFGTENDGYDELSRTVYIDNIPAEVLSKPEMLLDFCSQIGEVKYLRLAGEASAPVQAAFVEFSSQATAQEALKHDGTLLSGQPVRVSLSNTLINKPQLKSSVDAQKEIEIAMEQVRRAESLISSHASLTDPVPLPGSINKSAFRARSRSRSLERRRRSPSPKRGSGKRESRETSRKKSRSRSPKREKSLRRRSSRSRERSVERKKARERSRERKEKERERREKEREEREKERELREKEKEKERQKREEERSKERSKKDKERDRSDDDDRASRKKDKGKDRDRSDDERSSHKKKHKKDKKRKHKDTSRSRSREKQDNGEEKGKKRSFFGRLSQTASVNETEAKESRGSAVLLPDKGEKRRPGTVSPGQANIVRTASNEQERSKAGELLRVLDTEWFSNAELLVSQTSVISDAEIIVGNMKDNFGVLHGRLILTSWAIGKGSVSFQDGLETQMWRDEFRGLWVSLQFSVICSRSTEQRGSKSIESSSRKSLARLDESVNMDTSP